MGGWPTSQPAGPTEEKWRRQRNKFRGGGSCPSSHSSEAGLERATPHRDKMKLFENMLASLQSNEIDADAMEEVEEEVEEEERNAKYWQKRISNELLLKLFFYLRKVCTDCDCKAFEFTRKCSKRHISSKYQHCPRALKVVLLTCLEPAKEYFAKRV